MNQIIEYLNKNSSERSEKELISLTSLLKDNEFFESRNLKGQDLLEICKELKYECFERDDFIFKAGEYGDKFYIILKGTVSVSINKKGEKID